MTWIVWVVTMLLVSVACSGQSAEQPAESPRTPTQSSTAPSTTPSESSTPPHQNPIASRVNQMSVREKAQQTLIVTFTGTTAPKDLISSVHPGGLIYFSANLTSDGQIATMSKEAQQLSRRVGQPLLIMTDQEGGEVTRMPGSSDVPGGAEFHGDAAAARRTAQHIGDRLKSVGINTDLAPVADVNTAGPGGAIGVRSFSSDPAVVSRMVRAQICGFHAGGVAAAAKHFPGHGSTMIDSHEKTAKIHESVKQWRRTDLPPFRTAVETGVDMILVGHLAFPAIDPSGRPASISQRLNADLIRDRLGFDGVVVTDALNMGGVTSWGSGGQIAVAALNAGSDMLLMPPDPQAAVQAIVDAVHDGRLSQKRLDASVTRILRLKQQLGLYDAPEQLSQC